MVTISRSAIATTLPRNAICLIPKSEAAAPLDGS